MVTTEERVALMSNTHNIRNMAVISHVNHGKSTLVGSLVAATGINSDEASGNCADERGMTTKFKGFSVYHQMKKNAAPISFKGGDKGDKYLINIIDTPGHVDLSAEVSAALRLTDGALAVVDWLDGVTFDTDILLRQALGELIRPVLAVNKIDKCFFGPQADGEVAYQAFLRVIEDANAIMATYEEPLLGDVLFEPEKGNVAFSAGLHGWAFTLTNFAKIWASKSEASKSEDKEESMMRRLWGENYYDPATKKWTSERTDSATCKRGFVLFCYEPIKQVIDTCMNDDKQKLWPMLASIGVTLKADEQELMGVALVKQVMQAWLPVAPAVLEMMICYSPSPHTAQNYRVDSPYRNGLDVPINDAYATAIRNCDSKGPLIIYVPKMVPASDRSGRLIGVGRVFSGTLSSKKVRVMGPKYDPDDDEEDDMDLYINQSIESRVWMGKKVADVNEVSCGNIVELIGLHKVKTTSATLADVELKEGNGLPHPIRSIEFFLSPVLRVAVECLNPADLPYLLEGLKSLSESDPFVHVTLVDPEAREHVISAMGEFHLEISLIDLQEIFMSECGGIFVKEAAFPCRESVTEVGKFCKKTVTTRLKKAHNRSLSLSVKARPLAAEITKGIEDGDISLEDCSRILPTLGFNEDDAKKVWCFGPENEGPNILIGGRKRLGEEAKQALKRTFQQLTGRGALVNEQLRGVIFELGRADVSLDAMQTHGGEIVSAASAVFCGAQVTSGPRLQQPVNRVEIKAHKWVLRKVYKALVEKGGKACSEELLYHNSDWYKVTALLPAAQVFPLSRSLSASTEAATVLSKSTFIHWEELREHPFKEGSMANGLMKRIRKRKAMGPLITDWEICA